jgi:hypothetical protein
MPGLMSYSYFMVAFLEELQSFLPYCEELPDNTNFLYFLEYQALVENYLLMPTL